MTHCRRIAIPSHDARRTAYAALAAPSEDQATGTTQ